MNDVDEQVEREFDESSWITNEEYNSAAEKEDKDHGSQDRSNRSGRFDVWSQLLEVEGEKMNNSDE